MTMLATGHAQPKATKLFRKDNPLAHIPGEDGWPIIGNTLTVLRDPVGATDAMHAKYGPVFRSRVFGFRSVVPARPRGQRARAVRPGEEFLLRRRLGT